MPMGRRRLRMQLWHWTQYWFTTAPTSSSTAHLGAIRRSCSNESIERLRHSKLAGECAVRALPRHYVVRVASLFGGSSPTGQTATIDFMIDALVARRPVRALVDRTVTPSHVRDVASTTRALIERRAPFGTYHCVCSGSATWFDVASELARYLDADDLVQPARTADLKPAATRPAFGALSNQKLQALGVHLPFWQTALKDHLAERVVGLASPPRTRIA